MMIQKKKGNRPWAPSMYIHVVTKEKKRITASNKQTVKKMSLPLTISVDGSHRISQQILAHWQATSFNTTSCFVLYIYIYIWCRTSGQDISPGPPTYVIDNILFYTSIIIHMHDVWIQIVSMHVAM